MALGGCCTEALAVDPETGEVHDLTIRSFGIIRAKDMPPVDVTIVDDDREPLARARPTRCSPRSPPRPGTRSLAPKARGPIRSPRATRAPRADSGGSDARRPRSHAERAARRRAVLARGARRRLARARRARSASTPRPGSSSTAASKRRPARCSPTSRAVLADCGASLTDVAKTHVFVTDLGDFATVNAVYAEAFGDHRPPRSTVQVAALPGGAPVEIEAWAYVHRSTGMSHVRSLREPAAVRRSRADPARDVRRRADRRCSLGRRDLVGAASGWAARRRRRRPRRTSRRRSAQASADSARRPGQRVWPKR